MPSAASTPAYTVIAIQTARDNRCAPTASAAVSGEFFKSVGKIDADRALGPVDAQPISAQHRHEHSPRADHEHVARGIVADLFHISKQSQPSVDNAQADKIRLTMSTAREPWQMGSLDSYARTLERSESITVVIALQPHDESLAMLANARNHRSAFVALREM